MTSPAQVEQTPAKHAVDGTVFSILLAISLSHLLNDTIQSLIPAIYPIVKENFQLSFSQIGLITLIFQMSASLLQPVVGSYTDRKPKPFFLATGMSSTLVGLVLLSFAPSFYWVLLSVALIGLGSSVFHPEASRVAYMASGGRRGLAQSIFQVGGNAGSALGPLLAALIVLRFGQSRVWWFGLLALAAIMLLMVVGKWYQQNTHRIQRKQHATEEETHPSLSRGRINLAIGVLLALIFSKYFYLASMTSYFTFYLIERFQVSVGSSQIYLFVFLLSVAAGTFLGGPLGDRFGRKYVIWFSILGAAPFTLLLPHVSLTWTGVLTVLIGFILSSAFSAILVYAQELLPGKVGMISGLFFGFAFGMGGVGSALMGVLADRTSITFVYAVCAYLPLLGLLAGFLPDIHKAKKPAA